MRKGITLIESLFVLGIMAVLIGGVMVFYSLSNIALKSNQLITEVSELIQITQELNKDRTTFTGMNSQILAKTGLVSSKYILGGTLVTPWGGEIQAIPFNYDDNGPDVYLAFNILNLPREACEKLGMQDFGGTAQSVTVTNMRVDDTEGLAPIVLVKNCENGDNNYVNIRIMH
nr:type 4 pilus major pilin [Acetobacter persici]